MRPATHALRALLIAPLMCMAAPVFGQDTKDKPAEKAEPIVTDRPDFTESTDTVPLGRIQLEGGFTYSDTAHMRNSALGEILLRVASGRRTEVRIGINSFNWSNGGGSSTQGMDDATLGLKYRLFEASEKFNLLKPATSVILMTTLPTGSRDYRENNFSPTVKFAFGWELNKKLEASANVNYSRASEGGSRFDQVAASLSFGYSITERVGAYFEAFSFFPGGYQGANAHYLNTGVTYLVNNDYQLDARVGRGFSGARPDYFIGVGAARRW